MDERTEHRVAPLRNMHTDVLHLEFHHAKATIYMLERMSNPSCLYISGATFHYTHKAGKDFILLFSRRAKRHMSRNITALE